MGPRGALARSKHAIVLGIAALTAAAFGPLAVVSPARADPTVGEVEAQIDAAWNKLEPTIEEYNKTHTELTAKRKRQAELEAALKPLELQVDLARSRIGDLAAQTYKSGSSSSIAMFLNTGSANLLDQLAIMNQMSRKRLAEVTNVTDLQKKYLAEKKPLDELVSQLSTQDTELSKKRKQIESDIVALQKLRQQVYGAGGSGALRPVACPVEYLGGAGGDAIKRACAQIGKPYVYGAGGPDSFDCSGLTMYAWAGHVSLTHSAAGQLGQITQISRSELRPGDLVFYYSPIHHVGIYAGGGWIVHAPTTGDYVRMAKIDQSATAVAFGRPA